MELLLCLQVRHILRPFSGPSLQNSASQLLTYPEHFSPDDFIESEEEDFDDRHDDQLEGRRRTNHGAE